MKISSINNNIFNLYVDIIVNPVNCVGVSGAGLAKQFAIKYPEENKQYQQACKDNIIQIGKPLIISSKNLKICYFPTKLHWKNSSDIKYIEDSLENLKLYSYLNKNQSIAFPRIGCGLGGLNWQQVVKPTILRILNDSDFSSILLCDMIN